MKMEKQKLRLKLAQDPIGISVGELVPFDPDIAMYPIFLTRGFHATAEGHEEEKRFAHRIVSSFNACEGIPTEMLESLPLGFMEHSAELERLKAVNAQLLEVLVDVKHRLELGDPEFNLPSLNAAIAAAKTETPIQEPDYDNPAEREADQREADAPTPYDP